MRRRLQWGALVAGCVLCTAADVLPAWTVQPNTLTPSTAVFYSGGVATRAGQSKTLILTIGGCATASCTAGEMSETAGSMVVDNHGVATKWAPLPLWKLSNGDDPTSELRYGGVAVVIHFQEQQLLYLIGGTNQKSGKIGKGLSNTPLVHRYDCMSGCAWKSMVGLHGSANQPELEFSNRIGHTLAVVQNSVYVLGGAMATLTETYRAVEMISPNLTVAGEVEDWTHVTHHCCGMLAERCGVTTTESSRRVHHASAVFNDTIYIFGGLTSVNGVTIVSQVPVIAWNPVAKPPRCGPDGWIRPGVGDTQMWTSVSQGSTIGTSRWGFGIALIRSPSLFDPPIALAMGGFTCDTSASGKECTGPAVSLTAGVEGCRLGRTAQDSVVDISPTSGSKWTTTTKRVGATVLTVELPNNRHRVYVIGGSNNTWDAASSAVAPGSVRSLKLSLESIDLTYADLYDATAVPTLSPTAASGGVPSSSPRGPFAWWGHLSTITIALGGILIVIVLASGIGVVVLIVARRRRRGRPSFDDSTFSSQESSGITAWLLGAGTKSQTGSVRRSPAGLSAVAGYGASDQVLSVEDGVGGAEAANALEREYGASENSRLLKHESFIDPSRISVLRKLAKGGCGEVWLGKYSGNEVVLKALFSSNQAEEDDEDIEFWHEAEMLSRMSHPQVVRFFGVTQKTLHITDASHSIGVVSDRQLFIVMEYCKAGSIADAVKNKTYDRAAMLMRHILQIATALDWLHSQGVVHRDVKPGNVLLDAGAALRPLLSSFSPCQ